MEIVLDMAMVMGMDMADMEDISMENDHWRKSLKMLSTKDQLMPMRRLDMVLDMGMGLDLMGMAMGLAVMVTAMDMDMVMDMVVITMEKGLLSLWTMS